MTSRVRRENLNLGIVKMGMDLTSHAGFFLEYYEDEIDLDLEVNPHKRLLRDLKDVVFDRNWFSQLSEQELDRPVYLMFRDIARPGTKGTFNGRNVRVDITIIPARVLGTEPVKTLGHFHPLAENGRPFPEVYQVLWGKAMFVEFLPTIKDEVQDFKKIDQVNIFEAKTDNFVVMEGGHVTVNLSKSRPLILLNLVYSKFDSIYDPIKQMQGAPYFFVDVDGQMKFIKNKNYSTVPKIVKQQLLEEYGPLKQGRPIYKSFLDDPKFFTKLSGRIEKKNKSKKVEKQQAQKAENPEIKDPEAEKPNN